MNLTDKYLKQIDEEYLSGLSLIETTLEKLRGHDVIPHDPADVRIASELLRRWIAEVREK